jgi:KDO2-lipid IV(A) lauroyltransferase
MNITYYILFGFWYLISLLPLCVLYFISDLLFYPLYYLIKYRRRVVRDNLTQSFPEKDEAEIVRIEKQFYHFFCDYVVETIKLLSIPRKELTKRMTMGGTEEIARKLKEENKTFCFIYLGHYCNWEWMASLQNWVPDDILCAQIYHPLYNKAFNQLFLHLRNQFGGESIGMKETLRRIIELKREKQKTIIGFISDQAPKWNSIHHWTNFLNRETPVFIGTERIGKQVDALIYYADIKRIKRGYYHCEFKQLVSNVQELPDYEVTDIYTRQLEQMIKEVPQYWLWTHKRWKRTKEEWIRRQQEEKQQKQKAHAKA